MKNFKLLLATTAILSMGALGAYAEGEPNAYAVGAGTNTTLKAEATLINSLEVKEVSKLNFGGIVKPKGGQKVVVDKFGELVPSLTTATIVTAGFGGTGGALNNMLNVTAGEVEISGSYFTDNGASTEGYNVDSAFYPYMIIPNGTSTTGVPLTATSGESTITCGTVDFLYKGNTAGEASVDFNSALNKVTFKYGGTLTLDQDIETNMTGKESLKCEASVQITFLAGAGFFLDTVMNP